MTFFDRVFRFLLVILPFHVIISVFFQYKLGISGFGIYKDILVLVLASIVAVELFRRKQRPHLEALDYTILAYIGYLVCITLIHGDIKALIYGGRYDFLFLIAFLSVRHGRFLLKENITYYLRLFLWSGGVALFIGACVRFVFGENILLYFGFSPRLSVWEAGGAPPIYHGIEGASVRRFQGIMDGPNQAAFFILTYLGVAFHVWHTRRDRMPGFLFAVAVLIGLLLLTYSRSALLGLIGMLGMSTLIYMRKLLHKKYRSITLSVAAVFIVILTGVYFRYEGHMEALIDRAGSSKGHYERMIIGMQSFFAHPLGQGLGSSGPAYRMLHLNTTLDEKQYIPESWYIQQFVEGGIVAGLLFCTISLLLLAAFLQKSPFLFLTFGATCIMALFLHIFETSYTSVILFLIGGLFLTSKNTSIPHMPNQGK